MMLNLIHDVEREKAASIVKNITFNKSIAARDPNFNRRLKHVPQTSYLDADLLQMNQIPE